MSKNKTLSQKVVINSVLGNILHEKDVQEFIKRLKGLNWLGQTKLNKEIDKLAGERFNGI